MINGKDIVQELKEKKEWHEDQLKKVKIALSGFVKEHAKSIRATVEKGPTTMRGGKEVVLWKQEIDKLFEANGILSFEDVRDGLAKVAGIGKKAIHPKYRSAIVTTLERAVGKSLIKTSDHRYKKRVA
jgi:hypothetical protein